MAYPTCEYATLLFKAEQLKNNNYAKEIFTFSCNNLHSIE